MRCRLLGRSGLRVSELCLGATVFSDARGAWRATREDAQAMVGCYAASGGNFTDTASNYAGDESEPMVDELVAAGVSDSPA